jgi:competence protein ComEA
MIDLEFFKNHIFFTILFGSFVSAALTYYITSGLDKEGSTTESKTVAVVEKVDVKQEVGDIFVDLSGAVKSPGIYKLKSQSRIADAISLGGGIDTDASARWIAKNVNLSQVLKDSQKIYIPFEWDIYEANNDLKIDSLIYEVENPIAAALTDNGSSITEDTPSESESESGSSTSSGNTGKISLNGASKAELLDLPGVGEVTAKKILDFRPYTSVEDFLAKTGITATTYAKFSSLIIVGE